MTSFILVVFIIYTLTIMYSTGSGIFSRSKNLYDVSLNRQTLEKQRKEIATLNSKLNAQEKYLKTLKRILNGEIAIETFNDSVPEIHQLNVDNLNTGQSESEMELAKKVKENVRTGKNKQNESIVFFVSPVKGVVSQSYNKSNHFATDIVTEKESIVKSCMPGTIVFSGYSRKDGYILVVEHPGKYLSVYKHNKINLKNAGEKVQAGDPIAVVGNTGENSSGPHLHFELWYDRVPVDPEKYISFMK